MKRKKLLIALMLVVPFCFKTFNASAVIISAAQSGNWSSTSTWTGGVVPGALDDVEIVVDAAVTITIDVDVTVASIKLGAGGTIAKKDILILDTDKILTVTGNFVWDKVGVFQQNAGSSVTAANYVFGSISYAAAIWNINGTAENRASVNGSGNIKPTTSSSPPVQQVNWQYADFNIVGFTELALKNAWDANAYSSLNIDHCYFNATGYVDIGQYANSANDLKITNSDFRNTTSTLSGFNAQVCIRTSVLSTLGNFAFEGNVFSGATQGKIYLTTVGNGREIKDNVFKNRSCDIAYITAVTTAQKSIKVYNNVFCVTADAGSANGQLLDYGGGLEVYNNIFMGQPYNVHTIMFPGSYAADLPVTKIHNNVFDNDDGDSDVLNLNYVPVEITENIFIGNGTPINLGVSGGGGYGSLSPNSGTVLAKNNTSYLLSSVAWLAWAGETSQHTGGAVTFLNNLTGDNNNTDAKAYKDSQSTADVFDYVDYNWFYNGNGGTFDNYEGINKTGKVEGVDEGFGKYDQSGDPLFYAPSRRMYTFDASLDGAGTDLNLVTEMMKKNQNVTGEVFNSNYTVTAGLAYIREGFKPGNVLVGSAGQDGTFAGAIDYYNTTTWTGNTTDWNTPANWSTNAVPTAADNVTIPNLSNDPVINEAPGSPAVCHNLTISSGATMTIAPGKALTVNGALTNTSTSGIVIQSDASGTGSLVHPTANVPATMERYIAGADWGIWNDGWHQLSSPVESQVISPEFVNSYQLGTEDFYKWDEPTNNWISIKNSEGTGWTSGFETNFVVGRGYLVSYDVSDTKEFKGELNISDVNVSNMLITGTTGNNRSWHLLGNPFASALTWDATSAWNKINIAGVAKIWNSAGKSYSSINADGIIPAGNGFMVQVSDGTGSLNIPATKRTHNAQSWYKNSDYPVIMLYATNLDNPSFQESQVRFNPSSTGEFDLEYDSEFLPGYAPYFYSVTNNENLAVNSLPEFIAETVIPFNFIKNEGTNFSIDAMIENLPGTVWLLDKKTNFDHNLSQTPVYYFTSEPGDQSDRFLLHFGSVGINDSPVRKNMIGWYNNGNLFVINENESTQVSIYNIQGQNLQNFQLLGSGLQTLSVNMPVGVYFARIINNGRMQTVKMIVQ